MARDPARRGVAAFGWEGRTLTHGRLERAVRALHANMRSVGIVTGFCVVRNGQTASETDGPPGALYLARALAELGVDVQLITDRHTVPLLEAGCDFLGLRRDMIAEFPFDDESTESPGYDSGRADGSRSAAWVKAFFESESGRQLTHLIAVERAGPSHTPESLAAQLRQGEPPHEEFERRVPAANRGMCHDMRGAVIDAYTAKTHLLFDAVTTLDLPITTMGLADGGNEIGMGSIPWEVLRGAIGPGPGDHIACRVSTTHLLLSGVSNWSAYALAATVTVLAGRDDRLAAWDTQSQRKLIEFLVREAGAVDGVTGLREATVDGLPLTTYLQTLSGIRALLGCER